MECRACGAEMREGARFCGACGAPSISRNNCPSCGVPLAGSPKFCPNCGASLSPAQRSAVAVAPTLCPSCGAEWTKSVNFCGRCGTPLAARAPAAVATVQPRVGQPAKRAASRRSGTWVRSVVVIAVAAVGGFLWLRAGSDMAPTTESRVQVVSPGPASGLAPDGRPVRPHVALRHPDGATADVPAGPVLYSDVVDLRRVKLPNEDPRWDREGDAWEFLSMGGVVISEPVRLDLPVKSSASGAKVVVRTLRGDWADLPSEPVKLSDGSAGLRVTLKDVPTPWVVAVARPRAGAPKEGEAERLERLYWADRPQWRSEVEAWLSGDAVKLELEAEEQPGKVARPPGLASMPPEQAGESDIEILERWFLGEYEKWMTAKDGKSGQSKPLSGVLIDYYNYLLLNKGDSDEEKQRMIREHAVEAVLQHALSFLGAARSPLQGLEQGAEPTADAAKRANLLYRKGIHVLDAARRGYVDLNGESGRSAESIEWAMYQYAPWGLQLTNWLRLRGYLAGMDVRVLPAYGELPHADIPIAEGQISAVDQGIRDIQLPPTYRDPSYSGKMLKADGQLAANRFLRLYSPTSLDRWVLVDFLKSEGVERVIRWGPAFLALGGVVSGPLGWNALILGGVDELLNYLQNQYEDNEQPNIYVGFEAFGTGKEAVLLAAQFYEMRFTTSVGTIDFKDLRSMKVSAATALYGAGLALVIAKSDWYMLKDIRKVNEGTQGYIWMYKGHEEGRGRPIAPILAFAVAKGNLAGRTVEDNFPKNGTRVMTWRPGFPAESNLSDAFRRGGPEWDELGVYATNPMFDSPRVSPRGLEAFGFSPYKEDVWPMFSGNVDPDAQALRLVIPKALLQQVGAEKGLSPSAPLSAYQLRMQLEPSYEEPVDFQVEQESEPGTDSEVYSAVVLLPGKAGNMISGLPKGFDGAQKLAQWRPLSRQYQARLTTSGRKEALWEGKVVFDGTEDRTIQPQGDINQPRVQIKSVRIPAQQEVLRYQGTTSQGYEIALEFDLRAGLWTMLRWTADWPASSPPECGGFGVRPAEKGVRYGTEFPGEMKYLFSGRLASVSGSPGRFVLRLPSVAESLDAFQKYSGGAGLPPVPDLKEYKALNPREELGEVTLSSDRKIARGVLVADFLTQMMSAACPIPPEKVSFTADRKN